MDNKFLFSGSHSGGIWKKNGIFEVGDSLSGFFTRLLYGELDSRWNLNIFLFIYFSNFIWKNKKNTNLKIDSLAESEVALKGLDTRDERCE